ncbi:formimidoylglutamase [Christiangramia sp. SM2212]|uniref:Formimidoylglutamase n=1 Tax=Christiangramia sediminicola TaxID=3073267 RepID=A0ABU1ENP3_9FLAO|nr:formimidoylglutamase [Christiangramia sp. SM2212]MDR5589828.1 formimidoylglutamase [Christiangramia sp. SM2212]
MKGLKIYHPSDIKRFISKRKGETKFGEQIQFVRDIDKLDELSSKYVLLGVKEDIGVRANHGKPGTSQAWEAALRSLVNIQVNRFNDPENVVLLGELDCEELMEKASYLDESDPNYFPKLGDLVKQVDQLLSDVIEKIISKGKIPVVIGGGHNNAYGNIKGAAKALKNPINVVNIDAHTDLRQLEHRHSGNGFSYAIEGQYLRKYTVFGLHKNYTPKYIFKEMDTSENMEYYLAEDLMKFPDEILRRFQQCLEMTDHIKFGLELDCDAIANFPSSAKSPAGFSVNNIRNFIQSASKSGNCCYFHICEAAPEKENADQVGKALSYFISDFISD